MLIPFRHAGAIATLVAVAIAGMTFATAVRFNTFTPWGTDGAAYVEAAHRWSERRVIVPSPIALWASWAGDGTTVVPLGSRPGPTRGTEVSEYPPGLPILMAAALDAFGEVGPFLAAPIGVCLLVWCVFILGRRVGGPWPGVLAAALSAMSPITLVSAVQPMSDVPATALWLLAWVMAERPGAGAAAAAGAAVSAAILVRPNLAPLVLVIAALVLGLRRGDDGRRRVDWRSAALFTAACVTGPLIVLWSQDVLYGGPFTPGYRGFGAFYAWANVPVNAAVHARNLTAAHSPFIFASLLTPLLLYLPAWSQRPGVNEARRTSVAALAFVVVTVVVYLPYIPYEDPHYLRFLLPAVAAAFVLLGGLVRVLWDVISARIRALAPLALVPAAIVAATPGALLAYPLDFHRWQLRVPAMGHYLREVLPANAVLLAHLHGTAMTHYTSAPVVRLDLIDPRRLDDVVEDLVEHGYVPVLLLSEAEEAVQFPSRFANSRFRSLDWPPRARSVDLSGGFVYFVLGDRERRADGARWPTDLLETRRTW